jgi:hypothetical protein
MCLPACCHTVGVGDVKAQPEWLDLIMVLGDLKKSLQNHLFVILGWFFTVLGFIGIVLPLIPTTPFLIVALALFSKSSPRFHQMLLNNAWFGPILKQWENKKTLSRKTKYKAIFLIIVTFSISVAVFDNKIQLQLLLVVIAIILLVFIWRIKEHAG